MRWLHISHERSCCSPYQDDENVANLDVAKISLADVSHELGKAKHELELVKDAPIVSDVPECDECPIFKSDLASLQSKFATVVVRSCDCGQLFSLFLGLFHENQG